MINLPKKECQNLMKIGRDLGASFIESPREKCIIVCKKREGDKIGIARLMKGIEFVTPDYLIDCFEKKTKLTMRKYLPCEGSYF